jgi:hypothetical protein
MAQDVDALLYPGAPGHPAHDARDDLLCQRLTVAIEQDPGVSCMARLPQCLCEPE